MANTKNFIAKNGFSTGDGYSMPDIRPSLLLDFANSKTLDPRITFTRGSTATYWDGKTTAKADENLARYTDDFTTIYTFDEVTVTRTDTAPDGTASALRMTETTVNSDHRLFDSMSYPAGTNTTSVFAKYVDRQYLLVRMLGGDAGTYAGAVYDIQNGTVTSTSNVVSTSITSVGNGWYRLSVTANTDSNGGSGNTVIALSDTSTYSDNITYTGTGAEALVWGLQIENRSSATAYTPTTSSPIVKYQPVLQTAASGEARFDHDPVTGESKGLLIEEARTNLYPSSTTFTDKNVGPNSFVEATVGLDGVVDSALVLTSLSAGSSYIQATNFNMTSGTTYTISCWAKLIAGSNSDLGGGFYSPAAPFSSNTIGKSDINSETWTRVYATATATASGGTNATLIGYDAQPGTRLAYFGLQVEAGSFPTSYIPTSGSTVTRSLEYAEITGTSFDFFNNQESTLYAELDMTYSGDNSKGILGVNTDTAGVSGRLISMYLSAGLQFYFDNYSFGSVTASGNGGPTPPSKVALSFSATSYLSATDGSTAANTSGSYSIGQATRLQLGNAYNITGYPLNGHLKKIACYPKQLTSATLQAMTEE